MKTKNVEEARKELIGAIVHLKLQYGLSNQDILDTVLTAISS